jgi:hypothetical protein
MIKPEIQIRGIHAHLLALGKMVQKDTINIRQGMDACASIIFAESQWLVPVAKGPLKASGKILVEGTGLNTVISIQYGGETAPYAWIVHQDPTKYHKPPTQAFYISDAILNTKAQCSAVLQRVITTPTNLSTPVLPGLSPNIAVAVAVV